MCPLPSHTSIGGESTHHAMNVGGTWYEGEGGRKEWREGGMMWVRERGDGVGEGGRRLRWYSRPSLIQFFI